MEDVRHSVTSYKTKDVIECNWLKVAVGTNGYQGGDTGHGGRTLFELHNESCTDMRVSVNGGNLTDADHVAIVLGGDCELSTFKQSLLFAYEALEAMQPELSLWGRIKMAWKLKDLKWLKR